MQVGRLLEFGSVKGSADIFLALRVVWSNMQFGADKPVICQAFCSLHSSGNKDVLGVIDKMPLFGSGVQPGGLIFVSYSEHCVRDDEVILCTLV